MSCQPWCPSAFICSTGMYSEASRSYSAMPSATMHLDALALGHGLRRLHGPAQRAGVDRVHPLERQVLGQVAGLMVAGLRQLRIGRPLHVLHPDRERVADEQQLHGGSGWHNGHRERTGSRPSQPSRGLGHHAVEAAEALVELVDLEQVAEVGHRVVEGEPPAAAVAASIACG